MYWTNEDSGDVQRAALDGSNVKLLLTLPAMTPDDPSAGPGEIVLDLIRREMYWTAQETRKIQKANLDGSQVKDVVSDTMLESLNIALH